MCDEINNTHRIFQLKAIRYVGLVDYWIVKTEEISKSTLQKVPAWINRQLTIQVLLFFPLSICNADAAMVNTKVLERW
jgi:hypothetical protein